MVHVRQKLTVSRVVVLLVALLLAACGQPRVTQPATANPSDQGQPMSSSSQTAADAPSTLGPAASVPGGPDTAVSGEPGQPGRAGGGGVLQGQVTDSSGKPIAGVMVMPVSTDNPPQAVPEMAVMTNEEGRYEWTLTPGAYTLTFNAEGYAPATQDVNVKPDQPTTLDVTLQQQ